MDSNYMPLPERISKQFSEVDSDIVMDLWNAIIYRKTQNMRSTMSSIRFPPASKPLMIKSQQRILPIN